MVALKMLVQGGAGASETKNYLKRKIAQKIRLCVAKSTSGGGRSREQNLLW